MNANWFASGDQSPEEAMKLIASMCELLVGPASRRMMRPVCASATYRSMLNSPRREKKASYLPSGLTVGERL